MVEGFDVFGERDRVAGEHENESDDAQGSDNVQADKHIGSGR